MEKTKKRRALFRYHQTVYSKRFGEGRISNINHYDESNDGRLMYYVVFDNADHQASIWYDINGKWFDDTNEVFDHIEKILIETPTREPIYLEVGDYVHCSVHGYGVVKEANKSLAATPYKISFIGQLGLEVLYTRLGCKSGKKASTLRKVTEEEYRENERKYVADGSVVEIPVVEVSPESTTVEIKMATQLHANTQKPEQIPLESELDNRVWAFRELIEGRQVVLETFPEETYALDTVTNKLVSSLDRRSEEVIHRLLCRTDWQSPAFTPLTYIDVVKHVESHSQYDIMLDNCKLVHHTYEAGVNVSFLYLVDEYNNCFTITADMMERTDWRLYK